MARRKHDELTIDDLLKLQEGRPSKKTRVSLSVSVDSAHFNDETDSGSSASSDDDPSDQEKDSQDDIESLPGQVDEDQDESDRSELRGAMEDGGRLKLSSSSSVSTRKPGVAQTPKQSIRSFNDMGISSALEAALHRMSIHTPTEVQAACIPALLAGANWCSEDSSMGITLILIL